MNGPAGEWLEFARMDLRSAEFPLNMRPVPVEIICCHCQQAAEKALKAVLAYNDTEPPKIHDLPLLCELCEKTFPAFSRLTVPCARLLPYGVQVRYPSANQLGAEEMRAALADSREVLRFVEETLKADNQARTW